MPDILERMLQASQVGAQLGGQMFNNNLRMQQFQAEGEMRKLQEQQMTQQMALQLYQHNQAVQAQADTAKANAMFQLLTTPTLPSQEAPVSTEDQPDAGLPGVDLGNAPQQIPNPAYVKDRGMAYMKAYGPLARSPEQANKLMLDASTISLHDALAAKDLAAAKEEANGGFQPRAQDVPMPDGTTIHGILDSKNHWVPVIDPRVQTLTGPDGKTTQILRTGLSGAKPIAQDVRQRMVDMALQKQAEDAPDLSIPNPDAPGLRMIDPTKWDQFAQRKALPAASRNKAEEYITKLDNSIYTMEDSLRIVNQHPEALGPGGMLRSAGEIARGMAGSQDEPQVTAARDALAQNFLSMAKELRPDSGKMSNYELQQLKEVGDLTRITQFDKRAVSDLRSMWNAAIGKRLRETKAAGKLPDDAFVNHIPMSQIGPLFDSDLLPTESLMQMIRTGKITGDQAREIIASKPKG